MNLSKEDYDYPNINIPDELNILIRENIKTVERKAKDKKRENTEREKFHGLGIPYSDVLNEEQLRAVSDISGPMLVIAGAGSGKTRVIVYKVCFLIENGVSPQSIVLLTFTKRASREMLNRVKALSQRDEVRSIDGGTFHSFASRMLRKYHREAGIDPTFSIIDTADSADIISLVKKSLELDKNAVKSLFPNKNQIQDIISSSRNRNISLESLISTEHHKLIEYVYDIERIAEKYTSYKRRANVFDYDDLLDVFKDKLESNETFKQKILGRYKYFLVDEYQDTNIVQRQILKLLCGQEKNITVVGDDAQSIYAFRGANFENILSFLSDFPTGEVVKVERNYRSSKEILDFTNSVINNAVLGYRKHLFTDRVGKKPQVKKLYDEESEAVFVIDSIINLHEQGHSLSEIAVLYRSSWQSNFIQKELLMKKIPFITVGGIKFIERKHVKDTLSYLRVSQNRKDAPAWGRLLNMIDGVGEKTQMQIVESVVSEHDLKLKFGNKRYWNDLGKLASLLEDIRNAENTGDKVDLVFNHYFPFLDKTEEDSEIRKNDLLSLKQMAESYPRLDDF